tara:strand:+ start:84 stop:845 length:762 start_codon:yes stop_codon:yes gene_type:complete
LVLISQERNLKSHFFELNNVARICSLFLCTFCVFWSFLVDDIISWWLYNTPLELGPNNENLSLYGPFEWIQIRWGVVILLSLVSILPLLSFLLYRFASPGLYQREKNWLSAVLFVATTIIPLVIYCLWVYGIPYLIQISIYIGSPEDVYVRYDAASLLSFGLGVSWVLVIWSFSVIILSLTRIFGMIKNGQTRFRNRILAITAGILILTLPMEFDGIKILIGLTVAITADYFSRTAPITLTPWDETIHNDSFE